MEKQLEEARSSLGTVVTQVGGNRIGMGTPGAHHATRPCVAVIAPMVDVAWANLWRVVKPLAVTPTADDLKQELREELAEFLQPLRDLLKEKLHYVSGGSGGTVASSMNTLETEIRRVTELAEVEIDLAIHQARGTGVSAAMPTPTINTYSPVGAIQTGPGAIAIVRQHLDAQTRDALRKALRDLHEQLDAGVETSIVSTSEIADLATMAQDELNKPKPNAALLGSLLLGIATAVQAISALQPAYLALKAAAAAVGLQLP